MSDCLTGPMNFDSTGFCRNSSDCLMMKYTCCKHRQGGHQRRYKGIILVSLTLRQRNPSPPPWVRYHIHYSVFLPSNKIIYIKWKDFLNAITYRIWNEFSFHRKLGLKKKSFHTVFMKHLWNELWVFISRSLWWWDIKHTTSFMNTAWNENLFQFLFLTC